MRAWGLEKAADSAAPIPQIERRSPPASPCIALRRPAFLRIAAMSRRLDWNALVKVELPAPWQPFGGPESPHPNTMCENRTKLRDGFGSSWSVMLAC